MAHLLVHITAGVENPTKAALGLLVAATALADGHAVDVFVAGDGVSMLRAETADAMRGIGTGHVGEHLAALRGGGAGLYASGMSAAGRGLSADGLKTLGFTAAPPTKLVELVVTADRTITY